MFKIDERLPKESAKDYVVRQLVYNIVHINLTPGQQLDSDEISELLNVSKNLYVRQSLNFHRHVLLKSSLRLVLMYH